MLKSCLLIVSLLLFIAPASAQLLPSGLLHMPAVPDTVMTPENIDLLHYEVVPQEPDPAEAELPQDASLLASTELNGSQVLAYQKNHRLYVQETVPGEKAVRRSIRRIKDAAQVYGGFSPDAQYLVFYMYVPVGIGEEGRFTPEVFSWNMTTHRMVSFRHGQHDSLFRVQFIPGTQQVVTVDETQVKVWNMETGTQIGGFEFDSAATYGNILVFNPADDSTLIRATGQMIELIDLATSDVLKTFRTDDGSNIEEVIVSDDGTHLAAVTGQTLYVLDLTGNGDLTSLFREAHSPYGENHNIRFSPDGRLLFMTGAMRLYVFEAATGSMLKSIPVDRNFSLWMQMDADGRYLITWNLPATGEQSTGWLKYRWSVEAD